MSHILHTILSLRSLTYLASANTRIADRTRVYQEQQHKRHRYTLISSIEPSSAERSPVPPTGVPWTPPGLSLVARVILLLPWCIAVGAVIAFYPRVLLPSYACTQVHCARHSAASETSTSNLHASTVALAEPSSSRHVGLILCCSSEGVAKASDA
jgi:hypothetical protein